MLSTACTLFWIKQKFGDPLLSCYTTCQEDKHSCSSLNISYFSNKLFEVRLQLSNIALKSHTRRESAHPHPSQPPHMLLTYLMIAENRLRYFIAISLQQE